jgi:Putative prokaryotic signal transducing protein
MSQESHMKAVYHTPNHVEAALICGFLKENGIHAMVINDGLGGAFGEIPIDVSTMPTVMVVDEEAEKASALIEKRSDWIDDEEWGEGGVEAIEEEPAG